MRAIILILSFLSLFFMACGGGGSNGGNEIRGDYRDCSDIAVLTQSPISLNDLVAVAPLGTVDPPDHTQPTRHTYWYSGDPANPPAQEDLPLVYSPGNIRIFEVELSSYSNTTRPYTTDYTIRFFLCDDVWGYFNHVLVLDPDFADLVGDMNAGKCDSYNTSSETVTECVKSVSIDLEPGTIIGTTSYLGTLDFGIDDNRVTHTLANPNRFEFMEHAVCPQDYYDAATEQTLLAVTGMWDGSVQRTEEPRCGYVDFDIAGTASGAWVLDPLDPNQFLEAASISLARDIVDPSVALFSMGNVGTMFDGQVLTFTPQNSGNINRAFEDITDDQIYCYDQSNNSILIQLVNSSALKLEIVSNNCQVGDYQFSGNEIIFQR